MAHAPTTGFLRRWAVLAGVCLVASFQLAQVLSGRQSSWKGGGYGMYAGFHPNHAEIWAWPVDGSDPVRYTRSARGPANTSHGLRLCAVQTTARCLGERMPREDGIPLYRRIELWQRTFDVSTGRMGRRLIASYPDGARP
jgi:hypothetical protein